MFPIVLPSDSDDIIRFIVYYLSVGDKNYIREGQENIGEKRTAENTEKNGMADDKYFRVSEGGCDFKKVVGRNG